MNSFLISSGEITSKCEKLCKVINSKNTLPILDNLLFKSSGCNLTVTSSDSENTAVASVCLNEPFEGIFAVDSRMLLGALKELPEQPLNFEIENNTCTVYYMNGHFTLPIITNTDEFPQTKVDNFESQFTINADNLSCMVRKASNFIAIDELRPVMGGICIDVKEESNNIWAAASNGHQLIKMIVECKDVKGTGRVILPLKTSRLVETFIGKSCVDITVSYDARNIFFEMGDFTLYSRLIEGKYPNYESVIPKNYTQHIEVERKALLSVIKRVNAMNNNPTSLIKYTLSGFEMKLNAECIDYSTGAEEIMMVEKIGKDLVIGLKSVITINILNNLEGEKVRIEYDDAGRAILFKCEGNENILAIQMPMMV